MTDDSSRPLPVLLACAHGTRDAAGQQVVAELVDEVRRARPDLDVRACFVDVQAPSVGGVVAEVHAQGLTAVVVPLLLSSGYHVHVDIPRALQAAPGSVAAPALGPDEALARLLAERLAAAGAGPQQAVVLAAAGSSDPRAAADVEQVAEHLRGLRPGPVVVGYGASAQPDVPTAVRQARQATGGSVAIASYLLAPGHFHDRLGAAGADLVTQPLGADPELVQLALRRYDATRGQPSG